MKANALLKWLVPAALLAVVLIILKTWVAGGSTPSPENPVDQGNIQLSAEQAKSLGIAGDTPRDTVATLVGQVKAMRSDMLGLKKHNDSLQTENNRLRERENSVDSRIQTALGSVTQQVDEGRRQANEARLKAEQDSRQARGLLTQLQEQLSGLTGKGKDMPIGLGLETSDGVQFDGRHSANDALQWIEPSDAPSTDARGKTKTASALSLPTAFNSLEGLKDNAIERSQKQLRAVTEGERDLTQSADRTEGAKPVYTIPENATLMGSVAMTALIGRVPIDGTVNDPYPFKVLVGPDNLTANGIDIPDVAGAVFSGTASGDWTLSCVRGQVRSITFVFHDGTIRTIPEDRDGNQQNNQQRDGLGWISDPYGIPCVSGERRSNAQQYLGSQALITAAGAGVASLIDSDSGQMSYVGADGSIGSVGISGNEAVGRILAGGVRDMADWVNKLYGQAFAAIYVKPGAKVAVHLEKPLAIDFDPEGRKVDHRAGESHALELE